MMKCRFLIFIVLGLFPSFVGCAGFTKKFSKTNEEHLASIDKKIQEHEQAISNLNSSAQNLEKYIEELSQKTADMNANYSKLYATVNTLNSKVETKDSSLESMLSDAQKNIGDLGRKLSEVELNKKLGEIERAKIDLQNQIIFLLSQRSHLRSPKIKQPSEVTKEEVDEIIVPGREIAKNETQGKKSEEDKKVEELASNQKKEALQRLLDEALALYRDENYKEAIKKWEEVLAVDPENMEAKFTIEITKEKIKSQGVN